MAIDLMALEPHKVSRDLSGYITYIYGAQKIGKTTFASQMPGALILAWEKGYNALGGVLAQDLSSWSDMRQTVRELKKPEVRERFSSIIIDTIDLAAVACEKYIISQANVDTINQIPYGQGWTRVKRELEDTFRTITQLGYAVLFISHDKDKTFKRQDGTEYNMITPTLGNSYNEIIKNMVDIFGYAHMVTKEGQPERVLTLRSLDGTIDCGSRFKYMKPEIPFSYESLVTELNNAIDAEAKASNGAFVTDERNTVSEIVSFDYDSLMEEFNSIIVNIPGSADTGQTTEEGRKFANYYAPKIADIISRNAGKGKKIKDISREQGEILRMINDELIDMLKS